MARSTLQRVLTQVLHAAVAVPGVAATGCQPDGLHLDLSLFDPPVCTAESVLAVEGLHPAIPVDYIERRELNPSSMYPVLTLSATGTPCATAPDRAACKMALSQVDANTTPSGLLRRSCFLSGCAWDVLLSTRAAEVNVISDVAALDAFLAPYDTGQEAMYKVLATYSSSEIWCNNTTNGASRPVEGGFEVLTVSGSTCGSGGLYQNLFFVDAGGSVSEVGRAKLQAGDPNCVVGRRPARLCPARPAAAQPAAALGQYFADNARLEAAAVVAFRILQAELSTHGAPPRLVRAAARAAREEIRHAQLTGHLARRFGGEVLPAVVRPVPKRSLAAIAIENAAEGCVRETYGALVAMWQARHARDGQVRTALVRIARDETRHAALSWEVARWALRRLPARAQTHVKKAMRRAQSELRQALQQSVPAPELVTAAGLPDRAAALRLLTGLDRLLWTRESGEL